MPSKATSRQTGKVPSTEVASNESALKKVGTVFFLGFFCPRGNTKELTLSTNIRYISIHIGSV